MHTVLSTQCDYFKSSESFFLGIINNNLLGFLVFESTFSEGAAAVTSTNSTAMENGAQELEYFADSDYEGEQSPVVDRTNVFPQRDLNIRTVRITNVS